MKPKFYKTVLVEVPIESVLEYAYDKRRSGLMTLQERLPECKCSECGGQSWFFLPKECDAVKTGGKPYIECLSCGNQTHL